MATHDDPAVAWDRYDKFAEELSEKAHGDPSEESTESTEDTAVTARYNEAQADYDRDRRAAESRAMDDESYESRRNRLVADAAAGDPGEQNEPPICGRCMQYLPNCRCNRSDDAPHETYIEPSRPQDFETLELVERVGGSGDDSDDASDDDEEGSDTDPLADSTFNDRVVAFLEDLRDYLQAKPACVDDPEAQELVERAEEFIDSFA